MSKFAKKIMLIDAKIGLSDFGQIFSCKILQKFM